MSFIIRSQPAPTLPREGLNFWFDAQNHPSLQNDDISVDRASNYPIFSLLNSGTKVSYITDGGGSFIFTGITNSFVRTPINVTTTTDTVTWVIWFKRLSEPVAYAGLFYNRTTGATAGLHFGDAGNTTKLRYTWNNVHFNVETNLVTSLNVWTFCALSVRSNGATFTMITSPSSKQTYSHQGITNNPLSFTSSFIGWDGTQSRLFDGRVSQAFFYTRTLSDVEVQTIYDLTLSRHYPLYVPTTTTTTTSTSTSTTTTAPVQVFDGKEGTGPGDVCQGNGEGLVLYSLIKWQSLKAGDYLYLEPQLVNIWQGGYNYFYESFERQYLEIDPNSGEILTAPTNCP